MNILIFGPNGSGKGTQGAIVKERYGIPHVESGVIFRENVGKGTELGTKAKQYMERGELVPDDITIPMMIDRLKRDDCREGWLLDGFPRNLDQAKALDSALDEAGIGLDMVIEIVLDRQTSKERIMGRRVCVENNNHPNNIYIEAIKPAEQDGKTVCRVCGGELMARADDRDETAIDKRHDIYYDDRTGTMAAVNYFRDKAAAVPGLNFIDLYGNAPIDEVAARLRAKLT